MNIVNNLALLAMRTPEPVDLNVIHWSPREQEIIPYICLGFTNEAIASFLFLSVSTVKNYVNSIFYKVELAYQNEHIRIAWENINKRVFLAYLYGMCD